MMQSYLVLLKGGQFPFREESIFDCNIFDIFINHYRVSSSCAKMHSEFISMFATTILLIDFKVLGFHELIMTQSPLNGPVQ